MQEERKPGFFEGESGVFYNKGAKGAKEKTDLATKKHKRRKEAG
jgi:hypothetical protein